ncbi:MAG: hypothetical protein GTO62_01465 [Planctomycetales bacterium]|nr:hypothetical protein [Planctomycetales bacterium]NIP67894.1 hypothetical protein [Planctomycetales bacterium]
MIGYRMTRGCCRGWLFCGTTPADVASAIQNEIESCEGLSADEIDAMRIEAIEITQQEIDAMPEFQGW